MLVNHGSQILTCTDGCPTSAGSVFGLVLGSGSEDSSSGERGGSVLAGLCAGASTPHTGTSFVLGRLAGISNVGCTRHPSKK